MIHPDTLSKFFQRQMEIDELPIPLNGEDMDHILLFFHYIRELSAKPRIVVRYMREAFVCKWNHSTRVTFDRGIECIPAVSCPDLRQLSRKLWYSVRFPTVILEVKFTDVYPDWVQKMIEQMSLTRDSIAKYLVAVKKMNKLGFRFEY